MGRAAVWLVSSAGPTETLCTAQRTSSCAMTTSMLRIILTTFSEIQRHPFVKVSSAQQRVEQLCETASFFWKLGIASKQAQQHSQRTSADARPTKWRSHG